MLIPGTQIGPYEIAAPIGVGGMGEVYRATDTNLKRQVAIKVLPESVAGDPERLTRFQREAEVLAALNHPHIAQIYGLERSGPTTALVMELVEGPTLADRISDGPVPVDDALPIATQIAEALEAAHERGLVHRDLKPANVKVRLDGAVKVLDFGLAKAMDPVGDAASASASMSPTITTPAMTQAGIILGTAAYMSPEQARGKPVDKRADVWAFGVVLFEMLTGRRLFAADEVSDTLALVLTKDPDWTSLPGDTPVALRRLLRRCLQKDRSRRLADIADARLDLDEASTPQMDTGVAMSSPAAPAWRRSLPWAVAIAALVAAVAAVAAWAPWQASAPERSLRLDIQLGAEGVVLSMRTGGGVALSPDGSVLAFAGTTDTSDAAIPRSLLYVRRLDSRTAQALVGTTGASRPFFSPDGEWIGFFAAGQLKKVHIAGGAVVTVCDALGTTRGGSWGDDGNIVFSTGGVTNSSLMIVSSAGGTARELLVGGERAYAWPHVLPGSDVVLFAAGSPLGFQDATIMAARVSGGDPVIVQRGGYFPRYVEGGYLTYVSGGTLFAAPFDPERLSIDVPVPVAEQVRTNTQSGSTQLAVSSSGTLAYAVSDGASANAGAPMMWLDAQGLRPLREVPAVWGNPRFSPDGRRIAMTINDGRQLDVWVYDWERGAVTRITSDSGNDAVPVWTADGRYLIFGSNRGQSDRGRFSLYWQPADGTGTAARLTDGSRPAVPDDVDASGRFLAYHDGDSQGQRIMVMSLEGLGTSGWKPPSPQEVIGSDVIAAAPEFSPDGRWLAYASNESERFEVYVLPFPGPGPRVQVSSGGGNAPRWSPTSDELHYVGAGPRVMRVRFTVEGGAFVPSRAEVWSDTVFSAATPFPAFGPGLDLHPDGRRFVVAPPDHASTEPIGPDHLVLVSNAFGQGLRTLARPE